MYELSNNQKEHLLSLSPLEIVRQARGIFGSTLTLKDNSPGRHKGDIDELVIQRHVTIYLITVLEQLKEIVFEDIDYKAASLAYISRLFKMRCHASVIYVVTKMSFQLRFDPVIKEMFEMLVYGLDVDYLIERRLLRFVAGRRTEKRYFDYDVIKI